MAYSKGRRLGVLVDTSGALQDPAVLTFLGITDGSANQVLKTDGSGNLAFTTIESDKITEGNTEVEVTDTGSNGTITLKTEGTNRWQVTNAGHILPVADNTYDIGSSSYKIRDIYVSDGSIKMGSDTVLTVSSGEFQINDASGDPKKLIVDEIELGTGSNKVILKKGSDGNMEQQTKSGGSTGTARKPFLLGAHTTNDLTEHSSAKFFTEARARGSVSVSGDGSYNSSTGVITINASPVTSVNSETGAVTLNTADISESGNLYYTNTRARTAISVTDAGGDGSLAYNSSNGVITYTGPSAAEVRAHISAGTGVTVSSGQISIGQAVASTSNVTFNNLTVSGNLQVDGTTTTLNTATLDVEDLNITVGKNATSSSAANGAGLTFGAWSSGTTPRFEWDHSNSKFFANKPIQANIVGNVTGDLTGNADTATTLATARNIVVDTVNHSFNGSANVDLTEAIQDAVGSMFTSNTTTGIASTYVDSSGKINLVVTFPSQTDNNFTTTLKNKLDGIAASANNYSLPLGTSSARGGFKIGYTESGKNYPVELSSEQMYVNVPWTDTNTTYSVGDGGLTQNNFTTTLKNKLDGIEASATADQSAAEILTAIKTVDGSGSGLDADLLDGQHASAFAPIGGSTGRFITGGLYGTGHSSSTLPIWQYNSGNTGYGIAYTESSPDVLRFDVSGNLMSGTADLELRPNELKVNNEVVATQTWVNAQGYATSAASLTGSNSFTNSYNEFGNNTGAVSNDGTWNARVNISGTSHARLDLFEDGDDSKLRLYVHSGHSARIDTTSSTALNLGTAGAVRMTIPSNSGLVTTTGQGTLWGSSNDGSGSGLDADTLDGIQGSSLIRSDAADTFTGTLTMGTQKALVANNYGRGVYGVYSSTAHQHVWSMGINYSLADNGASVGNLYGISYTHTNVGTGYGANSAAGLGHQLNGRANGTLQWALGDGIYSAVTGNVWGASNDGSGSGLDADLLDGQHGSYYAPLSGSGNVDAGSFSAPASDDYGKFQMWGNSDTYAIGMVSGYDYGWLADYAMTFQFNNDADRGFAWRHSGMGKTDAAMTLSTSGNLSVKSAIGFGDQTGYYMHNGSWGWRHQTPSGYIEFGPANTGHAHIYTDRSNFYFNVNTMYQNGHLLWAANNDGSGSGLDADTVDGIQGSSLLRSDAGDTINDAIVITQRGRFGTGTSGQNTNSGSIAYDWGYQESGSWSHPYPDLVIGYHTGMQLGGHKNYNGTRFFNDHPKHGSPTMIFSVGNGDDHIRATSNIYAYTSDKRLKENFRTIENAVDKVKLLGGYIFDWREDMMAKYEFEPDQKKDDAGVIAQDVLKVMPAAVQRAPFDYDPNKKGHSKSGEEFMTVQYEKMVPLLIEAIKEQQKQIDELKAKLENK